MVGRGSCRNFKVLHCTKTAGQNTRKALHPPSPAHHTALFVLSIPVCHVNVLPFTKADSSSYMRTRARSAPEISPTPTSSVGTIKDGNKGKERWHLSSIARFAFRNGVRYATPTPRHRVWPLSCEIVCLCRRGAHGQRLAGILASGSGCWRAVDGPWPIRDFWSFISPSRKATRRNTKYGN